MSWSLLAIKRHVSQHLTKPYKILQLDTTCSTGDTSVIWLFRLMQVYAMWGHLDIRGFWRKSSIFQIFPHKLCKHCLRNIMPLNQWVVEPGWNVTPPPFRLNNWWQIIQNYPNPCPDVPSIMGLATQQLRASGNHHQHVYFEFTLRCHQTWHAGKSTISLRDFPLPCLVAGGYFILYLGQI